MPKTETELMDSLEMALWCPTCLKGAYAARWAIDQRTTKMGRGISWVDERTLVAWCPWCHRLVGMEYYPGTDCLHPVHLGGGGAVSVFGYASFIVMREVVAITGLLRGEGYYAASWAGMHRTKRGLDMQIAWLKKAMKWFLGDD